MGSIVGRGQQHRQVRVRVDAGGLSCAQLGAQPLVEQVLKAFTEHTVEIHLRETTSMIAITARRARGKWVKS